MYNNSKEQLLDVLIKLHRITDEQIKQILNEKQNSNKTTSQILLNIKIINENEIGPLLEKYYRVPYINLNEIKIVEEVFKIIPEEVIRRYQVIPIDKKENELTVAMSFPDNIVALDDLQIITGHTIRPLVALDSYINKIIDKFYVPDVMEKVVKEFVIDNIYLPEIKDDVQLPDIKELTNNHPLIKMIDSILIEAVKFRASDIHIEPQYKGMFVRYRIDGLLHTYEFIPKEAQLAATSRIKVMANLDITEKRLPQDGHIQMHIQKKEIDFRVSTLPSKYGEKIVIRVLDKNNFALDIEQLGFLPEVQTKFETALNSGNGIILVTGPTGSGKTTTLYSAINKIKSSTKNIITLEDPIEYDLLAGRAKESGIIQVQVNPKVGLTFAQALRASLRQDPDIILVGEIRDEETCRIGINAALMGHLVLSTIHTNDAVSTITRLLDMGIEPFLIASSLVCVLAQRLVRTLCPHCKEAYSPPKKVCESLNLKSYNMNEIKFYRPKGCDNCGNNGYKGRAGIYELLVINETIRELILQKAKLSSFREASQKNNIVTMKQNGIQLVSQGLTSISEILRVVPVER